MLHSGSSAFILSLILLFFLYFIQILCLTNHPLEIVPERVEMIYQNEKYMKNLKSFVRRNGRRGPYICHVEGDFQQEFGNNVSLNMIMHEYLHNEYRRSFVEFHYKLCDCINKDDFFGSQLRALGIPCPLSKVFPFKRAKSVATFTVTATGEIIAIGNFYIFFKQK